MKRLIVLLLLLLPVSGFAFDVSQLNECSFVTTKTFTKSDSMEVNRYIQSTQGLVDLFGTKRVDSKTRYVYQGNEQIELVSDSSWRYFFPDSWNGRGKGKLIYDQNEVMRSGAAGDMLVVANCDEEILLLLIKQNHPMSKEVYSFIGINEMIDNEPQSKPSFFERLFGTKKSEAKQAEKLAKVELSVSDEKPAQKKQRKRKYSEPDMDLSPTAYEKIDFEAMRHKTNKNIVIIGEARVVDGDTLVIEDLFNIRMVGIDAPESKQTCKDAKGKEYACGEQSTKHLQTLIGRGRVKCEMRGTGKYGRHTALCYNSKNENLNRKMVEDGYAVVSTYPPILFADSEKNAIENKLGIWQGDFVHPNCFRHKKNKDWDKSVCDGYKNYRGWLTIEK